MSEIAFLREIAGAPGDPTPRLIFADWLEERGDDRAEFLRLDVRLAGMQPSDPFYSNVRDRWTELRARFTPSWLTVLGRAPIENCHLRMKFACPKQWTELQATGVASVRHCDSCNRAVHYCHTIDEAREHAQAGECVAIDKRVLRQPGDLDHDSGVALVGLIDLSN